MCSRRYRYAALPRHAGQEARGPAPRSFGCAAREQSAIRAVFHQSYASLPAFGTTAFAELVSTIDAGRFWALRTFAASCARMKFDVTLMCRVLLHTPSAGTVNIDLTKDPIGHTKDGKPVMLSELWPAQDEVNEVVQRCVQQTKGFVLIHRPTEDIAAQA